MNGGFGLRQDQRGGRRAFTTWAAVGVAVATAVSIGVLPASAAPPSPSPAPPPGPTAGQFLPPGLADLLKDRAHKAKERFDRKGRAAPDKVTAWGVDEATGKMVVEVVGARTPETDRFTADTDPAMVDVDENSPKVRRFADLVGGRAIVNATGRCSVGVSALNSRGAPALLTAGHCTRGGGTWSGSTTASTSGPRAVIGPVAVSNFPADDFGAIAVTNTATWRPTGLVQGGPRIRGSVEAALRASVCRSGSTTGYRCGAIQTKNQTVNYGGGDVVYGLTRTSACAEPGDSGGTYVTPAGQAQGLLSGDTGDCRVGGQTYFQPLNEVLKRYGLRLVTG